MSAINNALSKLSQAQTVAQTPIEKATVPTIQRFRPLPWVIGGFGLSLAVGGWAITQQPLPVEESTSQVMVTSHVDVPASNVKASPTNKLAQASKVIYDAPLVEPKTPSQNEPSITLAKVDTTQSQVIDKPLAHVSETAVVVQPQPSEAKSKVEQVNQKQIVSPAKTVQSQGEIEEAPGEVLVEQVEFTPTQLAQKAVDRAEKALDANDLDKALAAYEEALRYTPRNSEARQKLAALYYGKGNARKAAELLQKGISLSQDDLHLRMALSKLLIKEKQNAAALTPLIYLPSNPNIDYLSLRAALAQKTEQNKVALESYQQLVKADADNGRWWLGLAIQLERAFELQSASQAYQQALTKVGLSSQSHQFIRDRLAFLNSLKEQPNAN